MAKPFKELYDKMSPEARADVEARVQATLKSEAMEFLEGLTGGPLTFGRLIQSIRLCEEESLEAFAEKLGVTHQELSDIEEGQRSVGAERAAEWANKLGYSPEQFAELARAVSNTQPLL